MNFIQLQPVETIPVDGTPILVKLESELHGSLVHVAIYHPNIATIAGLFDFDCPPVVGWAHIPTLKEMEGHE